MPVALTFLSRYAWLIWLLALAPTFVHADSQTSLQRLHEPWSDLLNRHVTYEGRLDYQGLQEDEAELLDYLMSLRKVTPSAAWTPQETKAFWLNVYNASAAYLVVQYYPVSSINDIRVKALSGAKSPWEAPVVNVGGQTYSLNQIEREKLSSSTPDPRIHFGLMYASASAAPMPKEAYDGSRLDQQLDAQTRRYLNDSNFNLLTATHLKLSGLFDAYAKDFGSPSEVRAFITHYTQTPIEPTATIEYLSFSWALNDRNTLNTSQPMSRH
ncbi:DUF547 domain-containing protein [Hymenobacter taeanensis]|uniref:DUF547 domain-containing protein n=1 Tax=Hymenobacter taeanensis TaxID=2735321 RepID=A0A6M6BHW3_9BACT|nr:MULTISPECIES: DUF547 domain-containing protein [Hymenobacter]QJX47686.1 DUF547 domain-containing protein [Hymenobacter taeanensis]UOQ82830.1 DUF547 domain-containing protein [Hymenobacter sp. 5414T-23]